MSVPVSVINRYAYVANNPFNFTDPTGMSIWGDIGIAILIVTAAAFTGGLAGAAIGSALGGGFLGALGGLVGGAIVGGLTGGLIGGTANAIQGKSFTEGFWKGAVQGAIAGGLAGAVAGYNAPGSLGEAQARALDNFRPQNGQQLAEMGPFPSPTPGQYPPYMGAEDKGLIKAIFDPTCLPFAWMSMTKVPFGVIGKAVSGDAAGGVCGFFF